MSGATSLPTASAAVRASAALSGRGMAAVAAAYARARHRLALWLPLAFAAGIAGYFALPFEPDPRWRWAGIAACLPPLLLAGRHPMAAWLLALPAAAALGAAIAAWHTVSRPPMPDLPRGAVVVTGTVQQVDVLPEGRRLTIEAPRLDGGEPLARRLRVRLRNEDPARPRPGDVVSIRALVRPPAAPAHPGAWDFQRAAWFSGVGGSGFAIGPARVEPSASAAAPPLAALRLGVEERVAAALPGAEGAIATALLIGGQSAIPAPDLAAMRDSGLAHILSVSGMHIAIVMGLVFGLVRFGLAAIPPLALRLPVKAIAALAALAAGGAYMLVTGAQVPMVRSFAMALLATVALLAGRRALTLRAWALALAVVLVIDPVALLGPSLQMSFAAVLALIAGWEALRPRLAAWPGRRHWAGRIGLVLGGVVLTSVLAGAATTPFGLHHFGRLQLYGVAANAVAVPLTSFLVMPAGLAAAVLMPLGLEAPALAVMGWGITAMLVVAREVASWPGAAMSAAPIPAWSLAVIAGGMCWLCLLRGTLRWAGVPVLVGGWIAGAALDRPPDLLVSADGRLIALRLEDGAWVQRASGASTLTREIWLRRWGAPGAQPLPREGAAAEGRIRCTPGACTLRPEPEGPAVMLLRGDPPRPACESGAALVVSAEPVRGPCRTLVIDRFSVWRNGAHAAWIGPEVVTVRHDRGTRGDRPWVPPMPQPRAGSGGLSHEPPAATE